MCCSHALTLAKAASHPRHIIDRSDPYVDRIAALMDSWENPLSQAPDSRWRNMPEGVLNVESQPQHSVRKGL